MTALNSFVAYRPGKSEGLANLLLLVLVVAMFVGCGNPAPGSAATKNSPSANGSELNVLATTAMVADVVREVGGEHVDVSVLLGPGVDPHLFRTTSDDVRRILAADMVFYSGLMLEGKMAGTIEIVGKSKPVLAITDGLDHDKLLTDPGQTDHPDPHVWFDVSLWGETADAVARMLGKQLPDHAEEFESAAKQYQLDLAKLDEYAGKVLGSIPKEQRILITSHDAFGYLGRAYEIDVMGVQGISTDSEAGLRRVNELVDLLVEKKVPAVFIESSVSEKSIRALIEGAQARGHAVRVGGELFSDAAGGQGTYEGTYIGMLDHNFTTIARGLGGEAPPGGMSSKLKEEGE